METRDLSVVIGSGAMCGIGNKTACLLAFYGVPSPSQSLVCCCCHDSFHFMCVTILVRGRDELGPLGVLENGAEGFFLFVCFFLRKFTG